VIPSRFKFLSYKFSTDRNKEYLLEDWSKMSEKAENVQRKTLKDLQKAGEL